MAVTGEEKSDTMLELILQPSGIPGIFSWGEPNQEPLQRIKYHTVLKPIRRIVTV